jgi:3-hydroxyisobutyrate dehydrogenase-like beta-hydroxyacid dehydrogenase
METDISFIGLGNMGTPMALNLLKHGLKLSVYNRTRAKAEPLIKAGAQLLEKPSEAFKNSSLVFSMLANDEALSEITEGLDGLLESAHEGCIHVSLSTVAPDTIKRLADQHKKKGAQLITAPVFGRPDVAKRQELWICMAGDEDAKKRVRPFLEMMGKKVYDFGTTPETANFVKISGNFMIVSVIEMLSEAFAVVKNNGINPEQFLSLMTETLFPSPVFQTYGKIISQQAFNPPGFKMKLGLKDLNLFLSSSEELSLDLPLAHVLRERFLTSIKNGHEDLDWSAISLLSQERKK